MAYSDTHQQSIGYLLWIFAIHGALNVSITAKPITGTICSLPWRLFFIGCDCGSFPDPSWDAQADRAFRSGAVNFNLPVGVLLTFLGYLVAHRLYMGQVDYRPCIYFFTGGLFLLGSL